MINEPSLPSEEDVTHASAEKADEGNLDVTETAKSIIDPEKQRELELETATRAKEDKEKLAELRERIKTISPDAELAETSEGIETQILAMAEADQFMRNNYLTAGYNPEVDIENTEMLRGIIQKHGWPTIPMVDEEASYDAWLIAQHADHDVAFQAECLEMMKVNEKGIDRTRIAYLEDRVLKNSGKPQIYGTQFLVDKDGKQIAYDTEDVANLDQRRAAMGLEPYAEYVKRASGEQTDSSETLAESAEDAETKVRNHLKEYLELSQGEVEKFTLHTGETLSPVFKKQYEALADERLKKIKVAIIPDEYWPKGKLGETESSAANGLITLKQSYYEQQNNPDEIAWMTHEFAHCQKYFDAGSEETYEKMMGEFAFADIGSEHTYPNNQVEQHTFTRQFEFLKRQGKNRDQIIEMLSIYYKKDDHPFFNKLLDEVYNES